MPSPTKAEVAAMIGQGELDLLLSFRSVEAPVRRGGRHVYLYALHDAGEYSLAKREANV